MDSKKRRIGNQRGLSMMEKLDQQLERMAVIEKELAKTRNRLHWQVRVAELQRLITTPNTRTHFNQIAIVHGADVFGDYEALRNTDWSNDPTQFNATSQGFLKAYSFQWDSVSYNKLRKAPTQLINMLNIRGNVTFLRWLSGHKQKGGQIKRRCDEARRKWEESTKANGEPYPEDAPRSDYEEVREPYNRVKNHEIGQ